GCLIFHRPDICSTTSLESMRTSTLRLSGFTPCCSAISTAKLRPLISPWYSATLLVACLMKCHTQPTSTPAASFTDEPVPAGPGLPREPPSHSTLKRMLPPISSAALPSLLHQKP